MAQEKSASERSDVPSVTTPHPESPAGDPWMAFGYLVSGVLLYGLTGWLLDRWWDTSFLVVVGILIGATLGLYQTWARFKAPPDLSVDRTAH